MRSALQAEDRLVTAAQLVFGVLIDKTKSPAEALDCLIMVLSILRERLSPDDLEEFISQLVANIRLLERDLRQ